MPAKILNGKNLLALHLSKTSNRRVSYFSNRRAETQQRAGAVLHNVEQKLDKIFHGCNPASSLNFFFFLTRISFVEVPTI